MTKIQVSRIVHTTILVLLMALMGCSEKKVTVHKPLFTDPNYGGSCDPEIVYNAFDNSYYIYYTARRSHKENTFLQTPIGVASSKNLVDWNFEGYCKFDGKHNTKDADATFWAPAIISTKDSLHMFVTYKSDTLTTRGMWGGRGAIVHYATALNNPINGWKKRTVMHDSTMTTLDASAYWVDDVAHLWFMSRPLKKLEKGYTLVHKTTRDFNNWQTLAQDLGDVYNKPVTSITYEEAPYIFRWKGQFWLITDPHKGFAVYHSKDAAHWKFQGFILSEPGKGKMDTARGRHGSVLIDENDRAFLFYHVEYNRQYGKTSIIKQPLKNRKSAIQMVELQLKNGKIIADRDRKIEL